MDSFEHECQLNRDESWLALSFDSNSKDRVCNRIRKYIVISEKVAQHRFFFRSKAAIQSEKRRHLNLPYWYIIHPFSAFRFYWEGLLMLVYSMSFFYIPLECGNIFFSYFNKNNFINYGPSLLVLHMIFIIDMALNFVTGYVVRQMKQIILEPRKIAKHYIWTYFFFDLISTLSALINGFFIYYVNGKPLLKHTLIFNLLKGIRIISCSKYAENYAWHYGVNMVFHRVCRFIIRTIYFFHWCSCLVYILPFVISDVTKISNNAWFHYVSLNLQYETLGHLYRSSFFTAINFILACTANTDASSLGELLVALIFAICGILYTGFLYVEFLDLIRSKFEPETKYDEFITQLQDYMRHNQLPSNIQQRMFLFYEHRYQKIYFKESAIMATLSEHLRKEINHYGCRKMMSKVSVFQGMSEENMLDVIHHLIFKVYLPKDIISKAGTIGRYIYFLNYGTAAIYTLSGKEICHLHDGDYFGENALLMKDHKGTANAVAVEICEVYLLDRDVFVRCVASNQEVYEQMLELAKQRIKETKALEAQYRRSFDGNINKSETTLLL